MMLWLGLVWIVFLSEFSGQVDTRQCLPKIGFEVLSNFYRLCAYSGTAHKRDINQEGVWYYNRLESQSEPRKSKVYYSIPNKSFDNDVQIQNSVGNSEGISPWQAMTWFNLSPPPPAKSKYDEDLDFAEIKVLVDPLNYGGSEIEEPIERWRRLDLEKKHAFLKLFQEFYESICCTKGCEFPLHYLAFAHEKKVFKLIC